jgi:peptidyl-prolyl cis-trans isomerase SurA
MKTMTLTRLAPLMAFGLILSLFAGLASPGAEAQQNLFAPRLIINDRVITNYEVDQRARFLTLLRSPGDAEEQALEGLIEDRLRMDAAKALDLKATEEQITAGMTEFASRANLTADEFVKALEQGGVAAQTFRDFVEAGLIWREVVRTKFASRVQQISAADIDRAISRAARQTAVRILLSELIIPAPPGQEEAALALAKRLQREIRSEAAFAQAARTYSAAGSAGRGGRMDWMPLANLPPLIAPVVLGLAPGQVSEPVTIPNAVALFQLRGIEQSDAPAGAPLDVDYAQYFLPNDETTPAAIARIRAEVDTCDDLYTVARGQPAERLQRVTQPLASVPQDIALELARLDDNESSTALVRGGNRVFLMLCSRRPQTEEPISRDNVRAQIVNQRLGGYADSYLAELRDAAIIRQP